MFGLNESTQYYVCQRYVRMNMGINGLYQIVRTEMELPPLGGAVFIFFSKNRQQVKMLGCPVLYSNFRVKKKLVLLLTL